MHTRILFAATAVTLLTTPAIAQDMDHSNHDHHAMMGHTSHTDHDHHNHSTLAPIGMMGDHLHPKGEWMFSYRRMHMNMEGNRDGTSGINAQTIATTVPNRFVGTPMQPPTLRVVPTKMTMDMDMFGAMYAPTDWLTVMGMVNYIQKDMDHTTFAGGIGTTELGTFSTETKGWGDTKITGLIKLYDDGMHNMHLNAGLSLPTGDIDKTGTLLAPNGMTPRLRLPYAMQLGTGTHDLLPGVTYNGHHGSWGWGAQYSAEIRLESENAQGYAWGDKHALTAWGAYQWAPWISTSARLTASTQDDIDGIDANIAAPVQTADPDNYGGDIVDFGVGVNLTAPSGYLEGHTFAIEANAPLYRDLNGPQLETDFTITAGFKLTF